MRCALICIGKRHTKVMPKNEYPIFGGVQGQGGICHNRSPRLDVFGNPRVGGDMFFRSIFFRSILLLCVWLMRCAPCRAGCERICLKDLALGNRKREKKETRDNHHIHFPD